jgi:hypothetical protein
VLTGPAEAVNIAASTLARMTSSISGRILTNPRKHPLFATLLLALHVAVLGAAPIADAVAESSANGSFVHVEAPGTNCPPIHNDFTCQFCRVVNHNVVGFDSALPVSFYAMYSAGALHASDHVFVAAPLSTPFAPRPPPLA